jgi:hypothetical protein
MDHPESRRRRGPGDHNPGQRAHDSDDETIQFGGLPFRWPFPEPHLLSRLSEHLPRDARAVGGVAARASLIALAAGLLIGFGVGRLTASASHRAGKAAAGNPRASDAAVQPLVVGPPIQATGAQCAVQIRADLQLGVEIQNISNFAITLDRIIPDFPMGGMSGISTAIGVCGALPNLNQSSSLLPAAKAWINATVAVRSGCPEALPVWFKVDYSRAGKPGKAVIQGFSDLGPVSYRDCATNRLGLWSGQGKPLSFPRL